MKTITTSIVTGLVGILFAASAAGADPYVDSWLTTYSARYARIYTSDANKTNGVSVTTWSNGAQSQSLPAYAGVQGVYSSGSWVYLRTSGLAQHTMGPWLNGAFPNMPTNTRTLYRFPRSPSVPASKTLTGLGAIGYFVDGVAMFDSTDAHYWNGSTEVNGVQYWNREAYVNEGATFDPGYAHQPQDGMHHYHASPVALRYLLGDHVDFNPTTKMYSESTNAVTKHSPLLGWVRDGYPVYGPYGYSSASNSASGLRRMISGYVIRNGLYGTSNLTANGRTTLPQWAVRLYSVSSNVLAGPSSFTTYPLGRYMEDNDYLGDHGYAQGVGYDLDEYNGRWGVTPEFPGGTYAYFVSISSNGTPTFPYNIGRAFYGSPTGSAQTSISETVVTNFLGGTNLTEKVNSISAGGGAFTLVWSAVEGGSYQVVASTNLASWSAIASNVSPAQITGTYSDPMTLDKRFYRVARTGVAAFDGGGTSGGGGGGGATFNAPGGSVSLGGGTNITINITLPANPPNPPANAPISSVTLAGVTGTGVSYATQGTVVASFALLSGTPTGTQNISIQFQNGPAQPYLVSFTINP